jgi:predicted kinase
MKKFKQELIIIRGLPGSGKSTLAELFATKGYICLEADYWHTRKGKYRFSRDELSNAHTWCELTAEYHIRRGDSVVVSNVFVRNANMVSYFEIAKRYRVPIRVIEISGHNFGSIHGVPKSMLKKMKKNWEPLNG